MHAHMAHGDDTYGAHADDDQMHAMMVTDNAIGEIMEAGLSDDDEACEAMWSQFEGQGFDRMRKNRFDRFDRGDKGKGKGSRYGSSPKRSYPSYKEHRSPSAGKGASRRFGPWQGAFAGDQRSGPPGPPGHNCCHAKRCGVPCKSGRTLCLQCVGVGRRTGKVIMWDDREQVFKTSAEMKANHAHEMHDDEDMYDEGAWFKSDDEDERAMHADAQEPTFAAFLANSYDQWQGGKQKRPRSAPAGQNRKPSKQPRAYDAELQDLLQQAQSGQSPWKEHRDY